MTASGFRYLILLACFLPSAATPAEDWKTKQVADWSETDAKDVLAESPWVSTVTPTLKQSSNSGSQSGGSQSRRMGGGGIGMGGISVGLPGMGGMGRRGGGGGYPRGGQSRRNDGSSPGEAPRLTLRWESAMPIRAAELKIHDNNAPTLDDQHYAIAVYGLPDRLLSGETKKLEAQLKKDASIKRDGKKDFKPSGVQVLQRPDGPVVVYLFKNSTEITPGDHRAEFDATIGRLVLAQSFFIDEMVWHGKVQL